MNDTIEAIPTAYKPTNKDRIRWKVEELKHKTKMFFVEIALKIIRKASNESNTKSHAEMEFLILGYIPLDQKQEDGPNKWIQQNVMDLLSVFALQGHSNSSAPFCIQYFEKLANFKPLAPITGSDDEWMVGHMDDDTYQNKRLSAVFKKGKEGKPYYLHAITWRTQTGSCYGGSALDSKGNSIRSSQNVKLPFTPKTFYVDVIEKEIAPDDWEFYIKDESQLEEVFAYYEKLN